MEKQDTLTPKLYTLEKSLEKIEKLDILTPKPHSCKPLRKVDKQEILTPKIKLSGRTF